MSHGNQSLLESQRRKTRAGIGEVTEWQELVTDLSSLRFELAQLKTHSHRTFTLLYTHPKFHNCLLGGRKSLS